MILKLPTIVLLSVAASTTEAFTFVNNHNILPSVASSSSSASSVSSSVSFLSQPQILSRFALYAESSETNEEEKVEAELTDDEPNASKQEEGEADEGEEAEKDDEEETKEPEEDPEITAIKNEISQLESQLKQKNRDLNNIERMAEEYTKGGYARKVAEMESFRRSRSIASTDNEMAARANVLQSFLPIVNTLQELDNQYVNDEFAKKYSALRWDFNNALKDLGMAEFTVKEGDVADSRRIVAVKEEYSDSVAKGSVISPVDIGYELDGNVMKFAEAVVSLGPEPAEEEEEAEEAEEAATEEDGTADDTAE